MMLDKYQEVLALQLVAQDGSLIEVYLALPATPGAAATWTIVQTIKGVTCAVIGLVILLAPQFMAPGGIVQMMAQSYLVGWFALLLGTAFIVLFAVRRSKARR